jgi:hypothetical protein
VYTIEEIVYWTTGISIEKVYWMTRISIEQNEYRRNSLLSNWDFDFKRRYIKEMVYFTTGLLIKEMFDSTCCG